jgi:diguanylate cyclase (GGDEF)-like protein/PAS domain S-box-containing protein
MHLALLLILSVWVADPIIDAYCFKQGSLYQQLTSPDPIEIYYLVMISALLFFLALIACSASHRANKMYNDLLKERELLEQIIEFSPECIKSVDQNGTLTEMNAAGLNIIEADTAADVCGQSVYDLIAPEDRQKFIDFNQRIFSGSPEIISFNLIGLKGTHKVVESHAVPIFNEHNEVINHLAITRDITEASLLTKQLKHQATHDSLTGMVNRIEFKRRLEAALSQAKTLKQTHTLLFIDLDQFKIINDTCGHMAGDRLLIELAQLMKSAINPSDSAARIGGDEFAILISECTPDEAQPVAEHIRHTIEKHVFSWDEHFFRVSVSIGLVSVNNTYQNIDSLLRDADIACFMAKDAGRNRIQQYQPDNEDFSRQHDDMQWVARIHEAIENKHFVLFIQTIESLSGRSDKKRYEILLRYTDEQQNTLPPGVFLPISERFGISPLIDQFVITSTINFLNESPDLLLEIESLSINLSGLSLADEKFLSFAVDAFSTNMHIAKKVCFEITETAAINNLNNAKLFIEQLKALGCLFSLDDFGSGLSSFSYLKSFPVDYIKIDGAFVRDILDNPIDLAIVRSINDIAKLMGKKTIAEFVENDKIKTQLQLMGVDYAQGYGIDKPFPIEKLISDLEAKQLHSG